MTGRDILTVAVVHEARGGLAAARVDRLLERIEHKVGAHGRRHPPAHDPAGKDIDDERDVDESGPGRHVGEVRRR
jgi:hypothetical protein